nr:hypothetical protein [Streptomyces europaeiscabiei]
MLTLSSLRTRWAALIGSFVAVALGVGVMTAMGLGLAATLDPPARTPERFGSSPVVVAGLDRLTVEVRRGPGTARVSQKLADPHPVDERLLAELRALGLVTTAGPPPPPSVVPSPTTPSPAATRSSHGCRSASFSDTQTVTGPPPPQPVTRTTPPTRTEEPHKAP